MGFYEELSRYYDEIFPVDAGEMRFVSGFLAGKRDVLDIGCGTGNKTVLLSDSARITGVDADPGMIARARADNARPGITYEILDMAALGERFSPASFDGAVCLGNTLVHLTDPAAIRGLCASVRRLLAPGGVFVCQILNYGRILDNAVTKLPVIETPNTRFSRFYTAKGDLLLFRTELYLKANGQSLKNETPLYPLRPESLEAMLAATGFSGLEQYGSYQGDPFRKDSFVIIVAATA
ncbi:putative Methyltransferase type 11 [uncultured delta proteobacterium]|uniref:Putative Methyltransferase type 11 n=1 Tax=uncultured delta proteobacterium TaxID=34034 RepID=A0A212JTP4_9DELT|nr:putative Methyltransferase type 11 [uncultured delta proteobacterium]